MDWAIQGHPPTSRANPPGLEGTKARGETIGFKTEDEQQLVSIAVICNTNLPAKSLAPVQPRLSPALP